MTHSISDAFKQKFNKFESAVQICKALENQMRNQSPATKQHLKDRIAQQLPKVHEGVGRIIAEAGPFPSGPIAATFAQAQKLLAAYHPANASQLSSRHTTTSRTIDELQKAVEELERLNEAAPKTKSPAKIVGERQKKLAGELNDAIDVLEAKYGKTPSGRVGELVERAVSALGNKRRGTSLNASASHPATEPMLQRVTERIYAAALTCLYPFQTAKKALFTWFSRTEQQERKPLEKPTSVHEENLPISPPETTSEEETDSETELDFEEKKDPEELSEPQNRPPATDDHPAVKAKYLAPSQAQRILEQHQENPTIEPSLENIEWSPISSERLEVIQEDPAEWLSDVEELDRSDTNQQPVHPVESQKIDSAESEAMDLEKLIDILKGFQANPQASSEADIGRLIEAIEHYRNHPNGYDWNQHRENFAVIHRFYPEFRHAEFLTEAVAAELLLNPEGHNHTGAHQNESYPNEMKYLRKALRELGAPQLAERRAKWAAEKEEFKQERLDKTARIRAQQAARLATLRQDELARKEQRLSRYQTAPK